MGNSIGKIKLALHNPAWFDDVNDIHLTLSGQREAEVYDTYDLEPIMKAIKYGLIVAIDLQLPRPSTGTGEDDSYCDAGLETNVRTLENKVKALENKIAELELALSEAVLFKNN